ncbi:aminoacyl-tRNA hydrolase [Rhodohalobacter mucosus]|uniref:Peptidyl-tRNA hydrolase n=1 Tax=Rhodohalobacter mucosus TaxID=2079485 RepID=A0A316TQ93_9BACT|nr:aminoacyl-tRNA hydrolase [Rhodohalobacter mucosus]PWN05389.1 aminoacyl-tRNA hydrolase [Rhodohalobacter mucosus]
MALIAGLGNPGAEYRDTRHNVGFELLDLLSDKLSATFESESGLYDLGKARFKGQNVWLVKPKTFMNLSGKAIRKVLTKTNHDPRQCLVCYDDVNLDAGTIRLRPSGSAGGHNGIQNIIDELKTNQFPRLRIGIGNNYRRGQQANYVLSPFSDEEKPVIEKTLEYASEAVMTFLHSGIDNAMNQFN